MGVSKWWNSRKADRQRKARDLDKILRKRYHSDESLFGEIKKILGLALIDVRRKEAALYNTE